MNLDTLVCPNVSTSKMNGVAAPEWLKDNLDDEIIKANSILIPKDKHGQFGSHDHLCNLDAATFTLAPKMGVPSHFVSSRDGKTESGSQTKHQFI